ncbi:ycf49-like protein isoform X3 [Salvia splendens]|uniref:ycf49-like protein isoform X3 n=1 Tax=Salvia splendens TaxID=180675 RepID=UPI001C273F31|nr:ycf49-like protein isoform X3 [Salvia splendens]
MVPINCLSLPKQFSLPKLDSPLPPSKLEAKKVMFCRGVLIGAAGITIMSLTGPSSAAEFPILTEPSNALSLPTWAVHVSSVVEWATAMALVWQYGEKSGYQSWKGLSWGMVNSSSPQFQYPCSVEHSVLVHGISSITQTRLRSWWLFKQL